MHRNKNVGNYYFSWISEGQHFEWPVKPSAPEMFILLSQFSISFDACTPIQSITTVTGISSISSSRMGVSKEILPDVEDRERTSAARGGLWESCGILSLESTCWFGCWISNLNDDGEEVEDEEEEEEEDDDAMWWTGGWRGKPNWSYFNASSYDGGVSICSAIVLGLL